jgi:transposase
MSKKRTYKSYTQEFKEEAVALVTEQGDSVPQAAESLGIRTNQLYQWKQKLEQSKQDSFLNPDEKSELVALRKEVKQLRMEKEILKKASAFFAKEMK